MVMASQAYIKQGSVEITSKRGNKIKKNAEPNNPAVHIKRSGNDVVKKVNRCCLSMVSTDASQESELNVEKKASGSKKDDSKKRKADEDEEPEKEEDKHVTDDKGNEVRAGGKTGSKAGKGAAKKSKKDDSDKEEEKKDDKKDDKKDEKKTDEKKSRGRPKSDGSKKAASKDKPKKDRAGGDLVSTRTRSQGKK